MQKRPTMYGIAEKLGISSGSVYRALNNKGRISPQTRQRVLDAAKEMGYETNRVAQSLRRSPIRIGVILCCPVLDYLTDICRGVHAALDELRQFNVFADVRDFGAVNSEDRVEGIIRALDDFQRDGVQGAALFLSGDNTLFSEKIQEMSASGIRIATIANDVAGCARSLSITADGTTAGRLATQILALGCRSGWIAILIGKRKTGIHSSKVSGFLAELQEKGCYSDIDVIEHDGTGASVIEQMGRIFSDPVPDGVYISAALSHSALAFFEKLETGSAQIFMTDLRMDQRQLLSSGKAVASIFQNPYRQCKHCIDRLYNQIINNTDKEEICRIIPQALFLSNLVLCEM